MRCQPAASAPASPPLSTTGPIAVIYDPAVTSSLRCAHIYTRAAAREPATHPVVRLWSRSICSTNKYTLRLQATLLLMVESVQELSLSLLVSWCIFERDEILRGNYVTFFFSRAKEQTLKLTS